MVPHFIFDYNAIIAAYSGKLQREGDPIVGWYTRSFECMECGDVLELPPHILDQPVVLSPDGDGGIIMRPTKELKAKVYCERCGNTNLLTIGAADEFKQLIRHAPTAQAAPLVLPPTIRPLPNIDLTQLRRDVRWILGFAIVSTALAIATASAAIGAYLMVKR